MQITLMTHVSRKVYPDDTLKLKRDGDTVVLTFNYIEVPVDLDELVRAIHALAGRAALERERGDG